MGWNIDRFIENERIMNDLVCSICTDVVQDAVQTPCQHVFCRDCIKQWLDGGKRICPVDRQKLTSPDLKPLDRFKKQFLDKLIVKCINHTEGCRLMARYEDMAQLIEHECNKCDNGNGNTTDGVEMQRFKDEIGKQIQSQTEIWKTMADMASHQVKEGSKLSAKVEQYGKEGLASGSSTSYHEPKLQSLFEGTSIRNMFN